MERVNLLPSPVAPNTMQQYQRRPLDLRRGKPRLGRADPWLFSPQQNFGCRGRSRPFSEVYEDYPSRTVWQPDVYAEAADLARAIGAEEIIDFGCGSGEKLRRFFGEGCFRRVVGVDFKGSLALARRTPSHVEWVDCNLGLWSDLARVAQTVSSRHPRMLLVSDVIEHLGDPRPLIGTLRRMLLEHPGSRLILSTPDRYRMHAVGFDDVPLNRCHVREWRLEELHDALAASGLIVERFGHTRSNLEDEALRTTYFELSASPEAYGEFLKDLDFLGAASPSDTLRLEGSEADWELVQQALFFVPELPQVTLPPTSPGESLCLAASAAGLLPESLAINERRGPVWRRAESAQVSVAVVVRNLQLSRLADCVAALNNQSLDPAEILIVSLGTRLDYRVLLSLELRGKIRAPYRYLWLPDLDGEHLLRRIVASARTAFVAIIPGDSLPLVDFLEVTARFLAGSPEATRVITRVRLLTDEGLHPYPMVLEDQRQPGTPDFPTVIKRSHFGRNGACDQLPVVGCLMGPAGMTEPAHALVETLWQWCRVRIRRWVRG